MTTEEGRDRRRMIDDDRTTTAWTTEHIRGAHVLLYRRYLDCRYTK